MALSRVLGTLISHFVYDVFIVNEAVKRNQKNRRLK
jgi:hypothetical protein